MTVNAVSRCVLVPKNVDGKLYGTANLGACRVDVVGGNSSDGIGMVYWNGSYTALYDIPATIYVATTGSDSNSGTSGAPYATINKALGVAVAGDVIEVAAGTYTGNSTQNGAISYWESPTENSFVFRSSGTSGQPIILRTASGASVTLDGESTRAGITTGACDYIYIAGFSLVNFVKNAIGSQGTVNPGNFVRDLSLMSRYCVVENCDISAVVATTSTNVQAIGLWGADNWIVRNNTISDVRQVNSTSRAAGIKSYGASDCLIEHNDITVSGIEIAGIELKSHYVDDYAAQTPVFGCEIRYNRIDAGSTGYALFVNYSGSGHCRGTSQWWHHNILRGGGDANYGTVCTASGGLKAIDSFVLEHNVIDALSNANGIGIQVNACGGVEMRGNIVFNTPLRALSLTVTAFDTDGRRTQVEASDYNLWPTEASGQFNMACDYTRPSQQIVTSLTTWKALNGSSGLYTIITDIGNNESTAAFADVFTDAANGDYSYKVGSPALAFMGDGSNAGPYQLGTETIGRV